MPSLVEDHASTLKTLVRLGVDLGFQVLHAEAENSPDVLHSIIDIILNLPYAGMNDEERIIFRRVRLLFRNFMGRRRDLQVSVPHITYDLILTNVEDVFKLIEFGVDRTIHLYYLRCAAPAWRQQRLAYTSPFNGFYKCSKNFVSITFNEEERNSVSLNEFYRMQREYWKARRENVEQRRQLQHLEQIHEYIVQDAQRRREAQLEEIARLREEIRQEQEHASARRPQSMRSTLARNAPVRRALFPNNGQENGAVEAAQAVVVEHGDQENVNPQISPARVEVINLPNPPEIQNENFGQGDMPAQVPASVLVQLLERYFTCPICHDIVKMVSMYVFFKCMINYNLLFRVNINFNSLSQAEDLRCSHLVCQECWASTHENGAARRCPYCRSECKKDFGFDAAKHSRRSRFNEFLQEMARLLPPNMIYETQ